MSFIIGKACEGVCDTICVKVCPVDCIHGPISTTDSAAEVDGMSKEELQGLQLYINPDECIDFWTKIWNLNKNFVSLLLQINIY